MQNLLTTDKKSTTEAKSPEDTGVVDVIREFSENTTAHGIRKVFDAQNAYASRLWLIGILFCFLVLLFQAHQLFEKFRRYEKITSIEVIFENVQFPAITFCNLNPYKKGLVQLVPMVKDTMDVFENAKSDVKPNGVGKKKFARRKKYEESVEKVKEMFRSDIEKTMKEQEVPIGSRASHTANSTINRFSDVKQTAKSNQSETKRVKRKNEFTEGHGRYEAMEASCECLKEAPLLECIYYENDRGSSYDKCICKYDHNEEIASLCFKNVTWISTLCQTCSLDGTCEMDAENLRLDGQSCVCHPLPYGGHSCLKYRFRDETIRELWQINSTTTLAPERRKNQSARVTSPETVKAMGFTGMTDGVAMLTKAKENIIFTMSAMSESERVILSQSKKEFIEMCSFSGKQCDVDADFKLQIDPEFGNCFTFNYDVNNIRSCNKAGPMYGIRVLLFVNTSDYLTTSESAGIRVAVHSPTEYPFPDTFGYSAPVGFASSFGIRKKVLERLGAPYGDCEARKKMNSPEYIYGNYDYSVEGCHRSCFQNALLRECGCGDPRFPVPNGMRHCDAFNSTSRGCLENAIAKIGDFHHAETLLNNCTCKEPCVHDAYTATFSAAKWPSGATDLGDCDGMEASECEEYYRKNAAMVMVYYEQLNYEYIKESEAYGVVNLLADAGGHLGLWMGFSVITVVECAVLFCDIVKLCCKRTKTKEKYKENETNHTAKRNHE